MIHDVSGADSTAILCLHCARRVVSPRSRSKYDGLKSYLRFRGSFTNVVRLSLAQIDGIIGSNLPMVAFRERKWWTNSVSSVHAKTWLQLGWEVKEANLGEGFVVFKKVREVRLKKHTRNKIDKPFKPVRVRSRRKPPSKTKVSQLYARIKNLERQRTQGQKKIRGLKPRGHYEKKLYKPDEKPK